MYVAVRTRVRHPRAVHIAPLLTTGCVWLCALSHLDADDSASRVQRVYTVILYLTSGARSTAFPKYLKKEFALPDFESDDPCAGVRNAAAMQRTVRAGLLRDDAYQSWPVQMGDMAIFSQATMHFGTANEISDGTPRQALFSILTPFDDSARQDNHQIFRSGTGGTAGVCLSCRSQRGAHHCLPAEPHCAALCLCRWWYVNHAFGTDSPEHAQQLWEDRAHDPIGGTHPGKSRQALVDCALKYKVMDLCTYTLHSTSGKCVWAKTLPEGMN